MLPDLQPVRNGPRRRHRPQTLIANPRTMDTQHRRHRPGASPAPPRPPLSNQPVHPQQNTGEPFASLTGAAPLRPSLRSRLRGTAVRQKPLKSGDQSPERLKNRAGPAEAPNRHRQRNSRPGTKKRQGRAKQDRTKQAHTNIRLRTGRSSKSSQATKLPAGNKKKARQSKAGQDKAGAHTHKTQDRPKLQIVTDNETPGREQKKGKAEQSRTGQSRRTHT